MAGKRPWNTAARNAREDMPRKRLKSPGPCDDSLARHPESVRQATAGDRGLQVGESGACRDGDAGKAWRGRCAVGVSCGLERRGDHGWSPEGTVIDRPTRSRIDRRARLKTAAVARRRRAGRHRAMHFARRRRRTGSGHATRHRRRSPRRPSRQQGGQLEATQSPRIPRAC